jgi:hypothetical protein
MRHFAYASAAVLVLSLIPAAGFAASTVPRQATTANPSVILAQGWWEHEHMERRAREGYWRLPPPELDRYNRLQIEINQLQEQRREIDERLRRAEREQHRMLGFGER